MILILEILTSVALVLYPLIEIIRTSTKREERISGAVKWISVLSIIFGTYLWLKNGLTLDYGTTKEKIESKAETMLYFGLSNMAIGLLIILFLTIWWVFRKIKKTLPNNS